MARCRLIRPEFFTHEALYDAEQASGFPLRVAYAGLWTVADREGRFQWRPRVLKLDILPHDAVDFEAVLMALVHAGFVETYTVAGARYGLIPAFTRHQKPHHREPASTLPPPGYEKAPEKPGPSTVKAVPRLTDTETVTGNRNTEAVAVTESDTEVPSSNAPLPPGLNAESYDEKKARMSLGFRALRVSPGGAA